MATDPFELYVIIAQIAAAFAGFGSLASGIGRRRKGGDDSRMDAYRLENMLVCSLSATLLGLFPAVFSNLLGGPIPGVRMASLFALAAILIYTPPSIVRARRLRHVPGFSVRATVTNSLCIWGAFIAFALCATDYYPGRDEALYLLGLLGLMGSSIMLFSRVIVSMLLPHRG